MNRQHDYGQHVARFMVIVCSPISFLQFFTIRPFHSQMDTGTIEIADYSCKER